MTQGIAMVTTRECRAELAQQFGVSVYTDADMHRDISDTLRMIVTREQRQARTASQQPGGSWVPAVLVALTTITTVVAIYAGQRELGFASLGGLLVAVACTIGGARGAQ